MIFQPSPRAQFITRRTYNRPLNPEGTQFETWEQTVARCIEHQRWLWERAQGHPLAEQQVVELLELQTLMLERKALLSGRTLWLGGTEISKTRECCNFNCAFTELSTVHDFVDFFWLLLNGVGPGFWPKPGSLNGFFKPVGKITVLRSEQTLDGWNTGARGIASNSETWDPVGKTWRIKVGDSAEAWAKSLGKLLAGKYPAEEIIIDLTEIRPAGVRLKGYGWLSQGDQKLAVAYEAIARLLSKRAGQLLTYADIHDIANWVGTVLSTRRSAQIAMHEYGQPGWDNFASFKKDMYEPSSYNPQREQSNNSLVFYQKPTRAQLTEIFRIMMDAGGSEPGFINGEAAKKRAPWFAGFNPCVEILLPKKGFCNLVTVDQAKFKDNLQALHRATYIVARANYRQTCVDLRDGILQDAWHQNNDFLRLCGVSQTGQERLQLSSYDKRVLKNYAVQGAYSMADELQLPRPKNVTTGKPEGTGSKIMDTTEGMHRPDAKYMINWVAFGGQDPLIPLLRAAKYAVVDHPSRPGDVIIALPSPAWEDIEFTTVDGLEINTESACSQLDRYKDLMDNYVEQNQSCTISYDPEEVPAIVDWLLHNWESYVGVSFLYRQKLPGKADAGVNEASMRTQAAALGYQYLPQQVVSKEAYFAYTEKLLPVDLDADTGDSLLEMDDCSTGACPIR